MKRYIAVDSGKFATKFAEYDVVKKKVKRFSLRTRVSEGDFRDDAIEDNTVIAEIDGKVYKIGNGARGDGANLETDKKTDMHKICTLTTLAMLASSKEKDELYVAIGLPAKEWAVVSKRIEYKEFMLPEGDITVSIKKDSVSEVVKKTFIIKGRYVFPESIGALFMDETISSISLNAVTGVIDLGNLNLNATLWQGTDLIQDKSLTAELGGAVLIQELSQELSSNITTCDEMITANILKDYSGDRHLPESPNLTQEQIDASRTLIKRVLKDHVEKIKRQCRSKNWSLDVTKLIAIGGTSQDLAEELKETFGNIMVLPDSKYCNVLGYLRMMCARIPEINDVISIKDEKRKEKEVDAPNTKSA